MYTYRNSPSTGVSITSNCAASSTINIGNSGPGKIVDLDAVFTTSTTAGTATFKWAPDGATGMTIEAGSFTKANKEN